MHRGTHSHVFFHNMTTNIIKICLPQYGVVLMLLHLHLPLRSQTSPPFIIASKVNHLFHQCTLVYSC
ncbi:unnamed protein product [Brassica rapa subsp. narinosa]